MKLKIILLVFVFLTYSGCAFFKKEYGVNITKVYKMTTTKPIPKSEPKPEPKPEPKYERFQKSATPLNIDMVSNESVKSYSPMLKSTEKIIVKPITSEPIKLTSAIDINSISKGDINYVVQDTMIVGVINEVNMTISVGVDKKDIISKIKTFTKDNLHTESIRISPVMKSRLVDASGGVNFKIVEKSGQEQFLEYGEITRWTWEVTPLVKGKNNLSLVVDVTLNNKSKTIQVYDGLIYVYSNETTMHKILAFISKNWQYLLSTLLLPFGIYLYNIYSKRKKENI
jgi:hypothetical protein